MTLRTRRQRISSFRLILLSFILAIIIGTVLLMLPISSKDRVFTPFINSLFTSTSAVCVTGLIVYDTLSYWSLFGQIVILLLIQIGGLGVIIVFSLISILIGKKISLFERGAIKDSINAPNVGEAARLVVFVIRGALIIEGIGILILIPLFCIDYGVKGIWMGIFHAVSAFCNAGFDIMGVTNNNTTSLMSVSSNIPINIVMILLIIIGGIGYLTWEDIHKNKFHFNKFRMQTKVILLVSLILTIVPAVLFFLFEFNDENLKERILKSIFQAVTPRTAGFNSADISEMTGASLAIIVILMLIGGSPGSTAGGMKTTTIAVVIASIVSLFRKKEDVSLFKLRISNENLKNAFVLFILYILLFTFSGILISRIENVSIGKSLFETASAIGTVGLSLGITPLLHTSSKLILVLLMLFGRVGGLTLIFATFNNNQKEVSKLPLDRIMVG